MLEELRNQGIDSERIVLTADQVVTHPELGILEKPEDREEAEKVRNITIINIVYICYESGVNGVDNVRVVRIREVCLHIRASLRSPLVRSKILTTSYTVHESLRFNSPRHNRRFSNVNLLPFPKNLPQNLHFHRSLQLLSPHLRPFKTFKCLRSFTILKCTGL